MSSTSLPFLRNLKAAQLKRLAFLIGTNTTGTKPVLLSRLETDILTPRLQPQSPNRILSIDMGIRNLAYCILDAPSETKGRGNQRIKVIAWKRIAVSKLSPSTPSPSSSSPSSPSQFPRPSNQNQTSTESFHPATLARTAHTLLTTHLLPYNPTTILIERQRYRSGGGAAVQEWTVRVNMFESIIYGVLETLRQAHQSHWREMEGRKKMQGGRVEGKGREEFPEVWDVNPKRVAEFWLRGNGSEEGVEGSGGNGSGAGKGVRQEKATRKGKIEKKEKIALVASWLAREPSNTSSATTPLTFTDEAGRTRDAFLEKQNRRSGGKANMHKTKARNDKADVVIPVVDILSKADSSDVVLTEEMENEKPGKLDDLADCLLQGIAWVRWEEERRAIVNSALKGADGTSETAKPGVTGDTTKLRVTTGRDHATRPRSRPKRYMD